jgi:hypothetical protein
MTLPVERSLAHARVVAAARTLARAVERTDRASPHRDDTPSPLPTEPTQALRAAVADLVAAERSAGVDAAAGAELASKIVRSALWDDGAGRLSAQTIARVLLATRRAASIALDS